MNLRRSSLFSAIILLSSLGTLTNCRVNYGHNILSSNQPTQESSLYNVQVFNQVYVYGGQRRFDTEVNLPDQGLGYDTATLYLDLDCPLNDQGLKDCDFWDRKGQIIIRDMANGEAQPVSYELLRFMTPYGVGTKHQLDVSDLLPILEGKKTIEVFIDTWVGPKSEQGKGWLVDLKLSYERTGRRRPLTVVSIFSPESVPYGESNQKTEKKLKIDSLPDHGSAKIWSYITGHGQNVGAQDDNCAEFCDREHTFKVVETINTRSIWRDNCSQTQTEHEQKGYWTLSRAGWCPGDIVSPLEIDIPAVANGSTLSWTVEKWLNKSSKKYDKNNHTKPYYEISALLILFPRAEGDTAGTYGGYPLCSSHTSDPDGDAWGSEKGVSCRVICESEESDHAGDGYGFEFGKSCFSRKGNLFEF